jgi:class 3 adenylate cyclase
MPKKSAALGDGSPSIVEAGREALRRRAWTEALELLLQADASTGLSPGDLECLADAAWCAGRPAECISARERAYQGYSALGDKPAAARMALRLAADHFHRGDVAVAGGWRRTADHLLEGLPECPEHGRRAWQTAFTLLSFAGDLEGAIGEARRACEIGRRFGDREIEVNGLMQLGRALIKQGRLDDGLACVDEAMTAAVAGELGPNSSFNIYCQTIVTCVELGDFRRGREWMEAAERCSAKIAAVPVTADCRIHRASLLRIHGDWSEAEEAVRRGRDEFAGTSEPHVAFATFELGMLRLRQGDLAGAVEAFETAHNRGFPAEFGLALVRFAEGKAEAAASLIAHALSNPVLGQSWDPTTRASSGLLGAQVEIALTCGDLASARSAADELESVARTYRIAGLEACALSAQGMVRLHEGDAGAASVALSDACRQWHVAEAPYEAAKVRVHLAAAHRALGDDESARLELRAALSTFERLGAVLDARRSRDLLGESEEPPSTAMKTFMFTDIVSSTELAEAMGDEAWGTVLRWHDDTLRSIVSEHRGEEIKQTGDGFLVAFPDAHSALWCAMNIQTELADHRRLHGYSPQVRIGVHGAHATRRGADYHGRGVNVAARICAAATAGEIVATVSTIASAEGVRSDEPRRVRLKGIKDPIDVATITWS